LSAPTEKKVSLRAVMIVALIVLLAAAWWAWTRFYTPGGDAGDGQAARTPVAESDASEGGEPGAEGGAEPAGPAAESRARWTALLGREPEWPGDLATPQDCAAVEADLARICTVIDSRHGAAVRATPGGSCGLVRDTVRVLAARPPVTTAELRSYQTILANVFHVFRVLGRERIDLLRELSREEATLREPGAMALYRWLVSRESCARSGVPPIDLPTLYEYATFLFQTMGGQAYLRRRTPESEALISFYALLIVDRAERQGHNPGGVDLRPEIRRTRALIDSSGLVFRERYAETLDGIARRWEERGQQ
jgi:hypothetical protein